MNVAAPVMPVRVGADQRLMSGEMLFAKLLAQLLRPVNGQSIFGAVTGGKADDVVVALYVLPFLVFSVAEICPHTGDCKILGIKCPSASRVGFMVNSSCSNKRYFSASP